jgi:NRPS condensation-like uncharacterized protein
MAILATLQKVTKVYKNGELETVAEFPAWTNKRYKNESPDLWHYYSWRRYESCIRMRIDFDGYLDETILAEAIEQSCVTFPLIACGFNTASLALLRWVPRKEAASEILRVVEARGHREDEIQRAFTNVPRVKEGPQLRVTLVRDVQQDSLCLAINHMVCDAAGFKQYLAELARLYSRIMEGLDPSPAPFATQRGIWPVIQGLAWKDQLQTPFRSLKPIMRSVKKLGPIVRHPFESGPLSILTASLPAENFMPIRLAAKTLGFTVNELFLAALALAWHRALDTNTVLLPNTIDLRRFAPPDAQIGITNLAGDCPCALQMSLDDTMEDVMAKLAELMKPYKQGLLAVSQLVRWKIQATAVPFWLMSRIFWNLFNVYTLSATNLGIIDEACARFGSTAAQSAYLVAAALPSPGFTIGMSTFRNELTLALSIEGDEAVKCFVQDLFATMMEELRDFGSRHPATYDSEVGYVV